jgi:hypothetical protein
MIDHLYYEKVLNEVQSSYEEPVALVERIPDWVFKALSSSLSSKTPRKHLAKFKYDADVIVSVCLSVA